MGTNYFVKVNNLNNFFVVISFFEIIWKKFIIEPSCLSKKKH